MKLGKMASLTVIASTCVLLSACSGPNPKSQMSNSAYDSSNANDAGAQTYGAQQAGSYRENGQTGQNIYPKNAMNAPANQTYYFAFDSSRLMSDEYSAMRVQANYLANHPQAKIRLEGNTDNRGSREYNVALGWRRAQAVAGYFEQQGVSPKQIQMVSYGKEHPAVLGNNERAWALNRRVNLNYKAY